MTCRTCNGTQWVSSGACAPTGGYILSLCPDCTTGATETPASEIQRLRDLLLRIRGWDMMDCAADGPFWRREIDAALKGNR